ncbi:MAG: hypothetical protein QXU98_14720 [Candidatus Parvarchaeota archaeon]
MYIIDNMGFFSDLFRQNAIDKINNTIFNQGKSYNDLIYSNVKKQVLEFVELMQTLLKEYFNKDKKNFYANYRRLPAVYEATISALDSFIDTHVNSMPKEREKLIELQHYIEMTYLNFYDERKSAYYRPILRNTFRYYKYRKKKFYYWYDKMLELSRKL